jgi:hypothetical protein
MGTLWHRKILLSFPYYSKLLERFGSIDFKGRKFFWNYQST